MRSFNQAPLCSRRQMHTEDKLVALLQRKDPQGFSLLYDRYAGNLYGLALSIVGSTAGAEEVVQDAFVKVWRKIHQYDPAKGRLFTWLLNIVRNTARDYLRSSQCHFSRNSHSLDTLLSDRATSEAYPYMAVDHIGLSVMLLQLPVEHQLVLEYVYLRGYTQAEAAQLLNMPLGTVKTRLRKAITNLRTIAR